MVDALTFAPLILVVLLIFFVLSIAKKLVKLAIFFALLFIAVSFITGGTILKDFSELEEDVTKSSVVLLEHEGTILTGIIDGATYTDVALPESVNVGTIQDFLKDHTKVYIISLSILDNTTINNKEVSKGELEMFFLDNRPIRSITYADFLVDTDIEENLDTRTALFAYIYDKELRITKSPLQFFTKYKEGTIQVYPETIFFKFSRIVPLGFINAKLNKLKDTVEDQTDKITGFVIKKRG